MKEKKHYVGSVRSHVTLQLYMLTLRNVIR